MIYIRSFFWVLVLAFTAAPLVVMLACAFPFRLVYSLADGKLDDIRKEYDGQ